MITQPTPEVSEYNIVEKIGVGSFSVVYKAATKDIPTEVVAIKCIDKKKRRSNFANNIIKEITLLKFVNHDNIVRLIDFSYNDKYIFIITEFCNEGDLAQYIRKYNKLQEPVIKTVMQQLASGIKFLNEHSICHMDLKPQNLLIHIKNAFKLKIADFGLAEVLDTENIEHCRSSGTVIYMAPEKLLYQKFDSRIDLWAVGAIMYECFVGRTLYSRNLSSKDIISSMIRRESFTLPGSVKISPIGKDLLFSLLKYDPSERLGFEGFFNHEFVDLAHMPTPDNYLKTVHLVEEAIALDEAKQYSDSLPKYKEAIKFLDAFINIETREVDKSLLSSRRTEYYNWTRVLNKLIKGSGSSSAENATSQPMPKITGQFYELTKDKITDSTALQALELGRDANNCLTQGNKALAFEKYTAALAIFIPLLNQEVSTKRREIIHKQIQKWLRVAEALKREFR